MWHVPARQCVAAAELGGCCVHPSLSANLNHLHELLPRVLSCRIHARCQKSNTFGLSTFVTEHVCMTCCLAMWLHDLLPCLGFSQLTELLASSRCVQFDHLVKEQQTVCVQVCTVVCTRTAYFCFIVACMLSPVLSHGEVQVVADQSPHVHKPGQRCEALAEVCGCSLLVSYLPLSHTCAVAAGSSHC
jgi:hypothetical protein